MLLLNDISEIYFRYFAKTENKESAATLTLAHLLWLCLGADAAQYDLTTDQMKFDENAESIESQNQEIDFL